MVSHGRTACQTEKSCSSSTHPLIHQVVTPRSWEEYVDRVSNGAVPFLTDFSYAGYKYQAQPLPDISTNSTKVFDVTQFGAQPGTGCACVCVCVCARARVLVACRTIRTLPRRSESVKKTGARLAEQTWRATSLCVHALSLCGRPTM